MLSQIDLIDEICKLLARHGIETLNSRQFNAAIAAADGILDALRKPRQPATPGMGLLAWLACDDTGQSSLYMAFVLAPLAGFPQPPRSRDSYFGPDAPYPRDPSDFGRCVGLLDAVPAFRPHLGYLLMGHGPIWAALVSNWPELESLYREELPSGQAPRLWARMQELSTSKEGVST